MPRKPRFFLPDVPVHIVIRGNSRKAVFAEKEDYCAYIRWLTEAREALDCSVHAYVLMTNHVHLLVSASEPTNISKLSQSVGRKYVPYFNHKYGQSGTLWEGRFKANCLDSERYLLACYRYIELNPVRAGMVKKPEEYNWSSYRRNAYGEKDLLVTIHDKYLSLGKSGKERLEAYRGLFREIIDETLINEIRASVQTGTPLGNKKFKSEIEKLLGVKVGFAAQGRPKRTNH